MQMAASWQKMTPAATIVATSSWLRHSFVASSSSLSRAVAAVVRSEVFASSMLIRPFHAIASEGSRKWQLQQQRQSQAQQPKRSDQPSQPQQCKYADVVLGISVRCNMAGYALLRFSDLLPLQFGLMDVRSAADVQQKANEIVAVLRDLRREAPNKLRHAEASAGGPSERQGVEWGDEEGEEEDEDEQAWRHAATSPEGSSASSSASGRRLRWLVSIDDSTVDRGRPSSNAENLSQRSIAMLQGLVVGDCTRLFKAAPIIANPMRSRQLLGVRGRGPEARRQIFERACSEVADFPAVRHEKSGSLKEDTFLMSEAWSAARYAQRTARIAELRLDAELITKIRREVLKMKHMQRMSEAAAELHPRKAGRDLAEAMAKRTEHHIDQQLHHYLDEFAVAGHLGGRSGSGSGGGIRRGRADGPLRHVAAAMAARGERVAAAAA